MGAGSSKPLLVHGVPLFHEPLGRNAASAAYRRACVAAAVRDDRAMKELEVRCPCCESQLLIDVLTEKVLRATPLRELDSTGRPKLESKDWDAALGRVSNRLGDSVSKFDASLDKERKRTSDLDELFAEAEKRARKRAEAGESGAEEEPGAEEPAAD